VANIANEVNVAAERDDEAKTRPLGSPRGAPPDAPVTGVGDAVLVPLALRRRDLSLDEAHPVSEPLRWFLENPTSLPGVRRS
jgi:hypothetical protein